MVEAYIPRFEVVGKPRRRLQEIKKGSKSFKDGKPRISRVIGGYNKTATQRYVPLEDLDAGFEPSGLPHVTREAALGILFDASNSSTSLTTALKKKTAIPHSPTKKVNNRQSWESKLPPNATPYQRQKMEETAYRNELKREFLNGEITFGQLALIFWGSGYSMTEPNLTEPELPIKPFNREKFFNSISKEQLEIMEKHHNRRAAAVSGRIHP